MSYGAHSNDFLFVECKYFRRMIVSPAKYVADGFFLDHNESDVIFLDDIISKELSEDERKELESQQGLEYVRAISSLLGHH